MSIDMAAKKAGIELQRDVPRRDQRKTKDWATLIGTARKLEAQEREDREESHKKIEDLSTQVVELTRENADLWRELTRLRLNEKMREMELPDKDRIRLLEEPKAG